MLGCWELHLHSLRGTIQPEAGAMSAWQVLAARRRPSHTPAYEVLHATASATAAKLEGMRSEAEKALLQVICWALESPLLYCSKGLAWLVGNAKARQRGLQPASLPAASNGVNMIDRIHMAQLHALGLFIESCVASCSSCYVADLSCSKMPAALQDQPMVSSISGPAHITRCLEPGNLSALSKHG